ncbi:MAG TPA: RsmE family RNA methyltransferase, partial [Polyangiaceae bacterium]|nr:RsmE family RNA methyltransferase [Polyangiaceae bacterium]
TLSDQRSRHLLQVLKVSAGSLIRIGVVDGRQGHAEVLSVAGHEVRLRCTFDRDSPPRGNDILLLAVPRPKVLARCLEHATALGFGKIILFRSRRVEKSHLASHSLGAVAIAERLRRGLEQSRRTYLPEVRLVERFRQLVETELEAQVPPHNRFVADADAPLEAALLAPEPAGLALVIGPEGGLVQHELEAFAARGFRLVRAGREPLRVESALSYLTGQLRAARQYSEATGGKALG